MSTLKKAMRVLRDRPVYLWQYLRGYLLFSICRALRPIALNARVSLEKNVRFQSIANFLAASETAHIRVGEDSVVYERARLEAHGEGHIVVGSSSILGDVRIVARKKVTLGDRALVSWNVLIQDFDAHPTSASLRGQQVEKMTQEFFPHWGEKPGIKQVSELNWSFSPQEIWIGDDVWLGAGSIVLKGSHIGSGSIVAAGAVVSGGTFPERSLIAGNPARWIKELTP